MPKTVIPFRRIKHGDPLKLKVLVEDLTPAKRFTVAFIAVLIACCAIGFVSGFLIP